MLNLKKGMIIRGQNYSNNKILVQLFQLFQTQLDQTNTLKTMR